MLTVSKRLQLKTTINNMNLQYPYDVLWAEIKDIKEELIDAVAYLTKLEKLLTGDNNPDKLWYDSEKKRK